MTLTPPWNKKTVLFLTVVAVSLWTAAAAQFQTNPTPPGGEKKEKAEKKAEIAGSEACKDCHSDRHKVAPHIKGSQLQSENGSKMGDRACEQCHGAGSLHAESEKAAYDHGMRDLASLDSFDEYDFCGGCHFKGQKTVKPPIPTFDRNIFLQSGHASRMRCSECHSVHDEKKNAKLKKEGDICFKCHSPEDRGVKKHPSLSKNCVKCHDVHGSSRVSSLRNDFQDVCAACHSAAKPEFVKKHYGMAGIGNKPCFECHSLHRGDEGKKLLKPVLHKPFEQRSCGSCHEKKGDGFGAVKKAGGDLCLTCHQGDYKKWMANPEKHKPVREKLCTACHSPHGSETKGLLRDKLDNTCFKCHSDIEKRASGRHVHSPVAAGRCLTCHDVKSSKSSFLLTESNVPKDEDRGDEIANKCHTCHKDQMQHMHKLGKGLTVPNVKTKKDVNCLSCHDVHGSEHEAIFKNELSDQCRSCHTNF